MAYHFLPTGDVPGEVEELTYQELDRQARAIAASLQKLEAHGERALLLFPPGLEFVAAFFGCLYSGTIAVPAYPPHPARLEKTLPRLKATAADCGARYVLTTAQLGQRAGAVLPRTEGLGALTWIHTDVIAPGTEDGWRAPPLTSESTAFLQYTSGSTGNPKGVIVSHGNILHNESLIMAAFPQSERSVTVSWLPPYHDMGLIGGILYSLYYGGTSVLLPPWSFLQSPRRWLRAIGTFGGTISPAPNFAYDLCARKVKPEEMEGISLHTWELALNGSEPVRGDTLERFHQRFAPHGFRKESLRPCYGLAEATLAVSGVQLAGALSTVNVQREALERGRVEPVSSEDSRARLLVASGAVPEDQQLVVVDPLTGKRIEPGRVGELWIRSESVASGYWGRPKETEETFGGTLEEEPGARFLRTGDLGFVEGGALYVTGRSKDLIIVRGRNCYPQDVELTVERAHPKIRPSGACAFSVEVGGEERLAVVAEVEHRRGTLNAEEVLSAIRRAVMDEQELDAQAIALVEPGTIPRTTSGKVRRRPCRAMFLDGSLPLLGRADAPARAAEAPRPVVPPAAGPAQARTEAEIAAWLLARVAELRGMDARQVDPGIPFAHHGLESRDLVGLTGDLQVWLGRPVPATALYDHPTIAQAAKSLSPAAAPAIAEPAPRARPAAHEPIAIIGMACRFPGGADTPDAFWKLLEEGRDAITTIPTTRWDFERYYHPEPGTPGKMYARHGSFLPQVDTFDAAFFGISPREASAMDPQQRMLLELSWEALERAAIAPDALSGSRTGVFVGLSSNDYGREVLRAAEDVDAHTGTGNSTSVAAGRLAFQLGLHGPCLSVDTACSSSLVAAHLACQSLRSGECDLALAGGASLILAPDTSIYFCQVRALSPDGRSCAFDASSNGYVRGEGVGMVALMRLSDARAAGHPVLALIRGSAVNHDGRSNGLTAPNGLAQQRVIREALADAGLEPGDVDYVEAHGTSTPLGDPIELTALGEALARGRSRERPLWVGSVKTNMGHLEAAAGVAGMIKTALALQRGRIPRHLHFARPNPAFAWADVPLDVPRAAMAWPETQRPRRAGVSSFGLSGTNAHVILEQAPPEAPSPGRAPAASLLVLSARSDAALRAQAVNHARALEPSAGIDLDDACYTAAAGRAHLERRLAVVGASAAELRETLVSFIAEDPSTRAVTGVAPAGAPPVVAFVFPGQGGQWAGMGRWLLEHSTPFREAMEACEDAIAKEAGWSLLETLAGPDAEARLQQIDVVQPALFAMGVGLTAHWRAWGVEPDAVVGHSMGEVAAAHVAGALSLEDAVKVICCRSGLLRRIAGQGAMGVVGLTMHEAEEALTGFEKLLSVAACNSPRTTVLSGDPKALEVVLGRLEGRGVFCRRVKVDVASHSPQVEPLMGELRSALAALKPAAPRVAMYSTVSGQQVEGAELDAGYWCRNLREPVWFASVTGGLISRGRTFFLEMSPHPTLVHDLGGLLRDAEAEGAAVGSLRRGEGEGPALLESLGALYTRGLKVDWEKVLPRRRRISLPTTPFQRTRHWLATKERRKRTTERTAHPWLSPGVPLATPQPSKVWTVSLGTESFPWLDGHKLQGAALLSGAGFAEIALAAGREALGQVPLELRELKLEQPLEVAGREVSLQLLGTYESPGLLKFQIASPASSAVKPERWIVHARGELRRADRDAGVPTAPLELRAIKARLGPEKDSEALYEALAKRGLELGEAFRGVETVQSGAGEALGQVRLPASVLAGRFIVHPALLDACFQVVGAAGAGPEASSWILAEIDRLRVLGPVQGELVCHVKLRGDDSSAQRQGAELVVAEAATGAVRLLARVVLQRSAPSGEDDWFLALDWERAEAPFPKPEPRSWLILGGGGPRHLGFALALRKALEDRGHMVEQASLSALTSAESVADLLSSAYGDAAGPAGILSLHALDLGGLDLERPEHGCDAVLHLVRALAHQDWKERPRLYLATRAAQPFGHDADLALEQAPILGLARVLAQEHPELRCTRVDLDPERPPGEVEALAQELLSDDVEDEICLRGTERWVARLARRTPEAGARSQERSVARADGAYLVTGGLGGLGLSVARWLAERGAGKLVLMGRTPPRTGEQEAVLRSILEMGVPVELALADAADSAKLTSLVNALKRATPPLRGIIHAAASLDDGALINQDGERFRKVLAPKAMGAYRLHQLTVDHPLDFFVLYSSATTLLGSPGLGNYVAANAFLDALAHQRHRQGLPALSVNWGVFSGIGLAGVDDEKRAARMEHHGMERLTPEAGNRVLERLLRAGTVQVGVVPMDVRTWIESFPTAAHSRLASRLLAEHRDAVDKAGGDAAFLKALGEATVSQRPKLVEHYALAQAARVLRLPADRISRDRPLTEVGLDSVMGLELRNRLALALNITLPPTILWTYSTMESLSKYLLGELLPEDAAPRGKPAGPDESGWAVRETAGALSNLSDAEKDQLLAARIADLEKLLEGDR